MPAPDFTALRESLNDEIADFIQQNTPGCNQGLTEAKPQLRKQTQSMHLPPFINSTIRSGLVLVTPEMATALLGKQGKNRRLSQRMVRRYADGFDGHTVIYQPIILDAIGRVLDGQHRLHAIVQYGKPVKVWFLIGVPASCWQDFDQGKARSLGDVLSGNGVMSANNVAALLNLVHRYEVGTFDNAYMPNRDALIDEYEANTEAYTEAVRFCTSRRDLNTVASPAHAGFIAFHMGPDAPLLDTFWNIAATGAGAKAGSPALQYRNAILTRAAGGRVTSPLSKLCMLIKAVNAEIAGKECKLLKHGSEEGVPVLAYVRGKMK